MGGVLLWFVMMTGCAKPVYQSGIASWYGPGFAGRPTASGVTFRPWKRTAAHPTLPFGTIVRVTRVDNDQSVRVVINDRGPFVEDRIIDLSRRSARRLDMIEMGVARVKIQILGCKRSYQTCRTD